MPKTLHIYDVSPFVHAGHSNKYSKLERVVDLGSTWKTLLTPAGGTSLIFNSLYENLGSGDFVFCCDRNPTIKKEMFADYKCNRDHKNEINVEKAVAEYILQQCNATVIARAGYEADDIIYTLVKKLHDTYDSIYIYTGDSDLYFLVDETVSIRPSSSRAKAVDRWNYERVLEKKHARYNSLTVQKILGGDTSDCVPPLPREQKEKLASVLYQENFLPHLGDRDFVRQWVEYICPEALPQVDLIFPLMVDDIPLEFKALDHQAVRNWGTAINNKMFRGLGDVNFDVKPFVEDMQNKGYYVEVTN